MAVDHANITGQRVAVPYRLGLAKPTHLDSAICPGDTRAAVESGRVLVEIARELCSATSKTPRIIDFDRPAPGQYVISYNDAAAGYPQLGSVNIP
jgi:hypothetical protein